MTDTDKLKRLAEEIKAAYEYDKRYYEANPLDKKAYDAILDLIAERDEAVALLRDMDGVRMYDEEWAPVAAFLARIDAKGSE